MLLINLEDGWDVEEGNAHMKTVKPEAYPSAVYFNQ